jgi:hypothetical protein
VLAPGSVHPDGTRYTWCEDTEMAEFPLWLVGAESDDKGCSMLRRTPLGDAIRDGVPEPEELERDILLKGQAHQIFTKKEQGKTWVALWLIKQAYERGQTAVFFDMENGKRIISERLQELGVGDDADEYIHYYDYPSLDMSRESRAEYEALLDELKPELIIFDSWLGFLGKCGFDENSNTDVVKWADAYVKAAKARDCTVVILDHIPYETSQRSRGASRKGDEVDVQWRLDKVKEFDRSTVGYIQLTQEKDREAWLPKRVGFSIGGTEEGFVMARSEGTIESSGSDTELPESAKKALEALERFGGMGARYEEWRHAIDWKDGKLMPDSTFRNARDRLIEAKHIRHVDARFYCNRNNRNSTATAETAVCQ